MKVPVKLRRDADGQFVCIPSWFELHSEDVIIRKVGDKLIIEPRAAKKAVAFISQMSGSHWTRLLRELTFSLARLAEELPRLR